jgi:ABC-type sugar transport system ATPase subunit
MDGAGIAQRVNAAAESLGLEGLLDRRPAQLSGGQRQRVALGRAIVRQPQAFLLDEPLSNLDPALRAQARTELRRLHGALNATVVYVTHDQEEAMTLGGRIAVMREGRIEQVAPPMEVYSRPANTFVAQFIGAPPMNFLPPALAGLPAARGATAGIRPQDLAIDSGGSLPAVVDVVEPRGHDIVVHLRVEDASTPSLVAVTRGEVPAPGARVALTFPRDRLHLFGEDGMRIE